MLFSYEQNKLKEGRMSSSMISVSRLWNTVTEILVSVKGKMTKMCAIGLLTVYQS